MTTFANGPLQMTIAGDFVKVDVTVNLANTPITSGGSITLSEDLFSLAGGQFNWIRFAECHAKTRTAVTSSGAGTIDAKATHPALGGAAVTINDTSGSGGLVVAAGTSTAADTYTPRANTAVQTSSGGLARGICKFGNATNKLKLELAATGADFTVGTLDLSFILQVGRETR